MSEDVFEQYRPLLLGLGYRLLGSMWDAEDVVQEAYLRWMRTDQSEIREPRAFLITVVSRLALDQLRSARVTREAYVGPWLPEPVDAEGLGPLDTAELRDTLSYATLHMMEELTPPQRAVFVLREAFQLPYEEIAEIVGSSPATCRQLHSRAAKQLARSDHRFEPSSADVAALVGRFMVAAQGGDIDALKELLAEDVVTWNDGGGKVRAVGHPVVGRTQVVRLMLGLARRFPPEGAHLVEVNGEPAIRASIEGRPYVIAFDIREGEIHGIFGILNPDKLTRLDQPRGA